MPNKTAQPTKRPARMFNDEAIVERKAVNLHTMTLPPIRLIVLDATYTETLQTWLYKCGRPTERNPNRADKRCKPIILPEEKLELIRQS
jgi:hypothetical protein